MNSRFSVGGTLCDLEKDFDCVNRGNVVHKLEFSGIGAKSYLTDRYQNVLITTITAYYGVSSRSKKFINGVPRGLILGSLFLLIYINDLPQHNT
jgi:hypothetical protein